MLESYTHVFHRIDNALILSEELEESAVQALIDVGIADRFPELCDKWHATNHDIRSRYREKLEKRMDMVHQEIARGLGLLQCALREVVVEDVLRFFPYVLIHDVLSGTAMTYFTRFRSLQRDDLFISVQDSSHLDASQEATGRVFLWLTFSVSQCLMDFSGSVRLSDLESLYPSFRIVYQKYLHDARFDLVLRRDPGFESRKLRLLAVVYLLEKNQGLDTRGRAELIHDVLVEGDFHLEQQTLSRTEEKKPVGTSLWGARPLFSASGSSEDSFEKEMRTLAARVPDAQFLLMMKSEGNKELRPVIDEVETLAHTQLVTSIDAVVTTMAHAVSAMQQEHCERAVQHEMDSEERKSRSKVLTKFIQDINAQAAGSQDSYASLSSLGDESLILHSVVYLDGIITTQSVGSRGS